MSDNIHDRIHATATAFALKYRGAPTRLYLGRAEVLDLYAGSNSAFVQAANAAQARGEPFTVHGLAMYQVKSESHLAVA